MVAFVNTSISSCKFPDSEKRAVIKPVLKGILDYQNVSSYRPVSNLPFLSKLLEYVVIEQLMEHLEKVHVLPDSQSAYGPVFSTETTICSVVNNLLEMMDEGKCAILVLLDLSAALDTVVHELLLEDLRNIGVVDNALKYLGSYLQNRS